MPSDIHIDPPAARPRIAIHTPIHRRRCGYDYRFVPAIIATACAQTYPNWTLRLLDDRNTVFDLDEVLDEAERLLGGPVLTERIRYERMDLGPVGCKRQHLVDTEDSDTDVVVNFDDDDVYGPGYLDAVLRHFVEHPRCGAILGGRTRFYHYQTVKAGPAMDWKGGSAIFSMRTDWMRTVFASVRYTDDRTASDSKWRREVQSQFVLHDVTTNRLPILFGAHDGQMSTKHGPRTPSDVPDDDRRILREVSAPQLWGFYEGLAVR